MTKKTVPAYMGGQRFSAILIHEFESIQICPWCGTEIRIGRNKFNNDIPVEWCRTWGWTCHMRNCKDFNMNQFLGMKEEPEIEEDFLDIDEA